MLAYGQRMNRKAVEPEALATYWTDRIDHLLRACVRDRDSLPADRTIDVPFHIFMQDDLAMVEEIYARAGLDLNAEQRRPLEAFLADHPPPPLRYRYPPHTLPLPSSRQIHRRAQEHPNTERGADPT